MGGLPVPPKQCGGYYLLLWLLWLQSLAGLAAANRFVGNKKEVKRQIGNAVPVPVAQWLGQRVAATLGKAQQAA